MAGLAVRSYLGRCYLLDDTAVLLVVFVPMGLMQLY